MADPADDLAWLAAGATEEALEVVLEAYAGARRGPLDPHLLERARLVSELALAEGTDEVAAESLLDQVLAS